MEAMVSKKQSMLCHSAPDSLNTKTLFWWGYIRYRYSIAIKEGMSAASIYNPYIPRSYTAVRQNEAHTDGVINKTRTSLMEYMHPRDRDAMMLQALKADAHLWTNKIALQSNAANIENFKESQKKLSTWRGEYVSKQMLPNRTTDLVQTPQSYAVTPKFSLVKYMHFKGRKETLPKAVKWTALTQGHLHESDNHGGVNYIISGIINTIQMGDVSKETLGVDVRTYNEVLRRKFDGLMLSIS